MRILLITDWNAGRGGAEAYMACLRDSLRESGDEVRLLTSSAGTAADGTADYVAFGTGNPAAQSLLQIHNLPAARCVRRAVSGFRPDVALVNMFAHHLSPAAVFALGDVPSVLLVSDYKCVCPTGSKLLPDGSICRVPAGAVCWRKGCVGAMHWLRDRPRYALIRAAVKRFRRVVACSGWVRGELARHGIDAEVLLLPVPAPSARFRRRVTADPVFLFVGRLDREKGLELLIRAFARLRLVFPRGRLHIAGRGPLRGKLEGMVRAGGLADAVSFLGWLTPADVERHLEEAWAMVVPSLWAEPLGLVAIEAVVRGVPVVASAQGGLAEVVEHGVTGLLFANSDEEGLVEMLAAIAAGRAFSGLSLPADAVRRAAEKFDINAHGRAMREVLAAAAAPRTERECAIQGSNL